MRPRSGALPAMTLASPSRAVPCSPSHEASRPRPVPPLHPDRRADRGQQSPAGAACPVAAAASRRHAGLSAGDRRAAAGRAGGAGHGLVGRPPPSPARPRSERRGRAAGSRGASACARPTAVDGPAPASGPAPRDQKAIERQARWSRPNSPRRPARAAPSREDPLGRRGRCRSRRPGADRPPRRAVPRRLRDAGAPSSHDCPADRPRLGRRHAAPDAGLDARCRAAISASRWSRSSPTTAARSLPSIYGQYLLLDGTTGQTVAMLDGTMLTKRRTACASGLASRYLSRPDARRLADDRHRRPGAPAHPRPRQGAADRGGRDLGPAAGPGGQSCPGTFSIAAAGAGAADRRARGDRPPAGGRRGRYHLVCNAFQHAAGRRRLAARGPACRPGRRLHAEDARERR